MQIPPIIVAVDGFSSTGKSTLAKLIAKEFSLLYLDSGALYRAVTLFAQERGLIDSDNSIDEQGLRAALPSLDLHFEFIDGASKTFISERCVESEIRTMKVSSQVSPVSALPFVRNFVDDRLHKFGEAKGIVMDGRDIGTTVFPKAEVKLFLTASAEVRARRRFDEMQAKGDNSPFEEVLKNLQERDYADSHRETSPLVQAEDAYVLDNSDLTLKEELVWMRGLLQGKFDIRQ